jgi:hypothetical protein
MTQEIKLKLTIDGKEVQAGLRLTETELKKLAQQMADAQRGARGFGGQMKDAGLAIFGAKQALDLLNATLGQSVRLFQVQEQAEAALAQAMRSSGQYTEESFQAMKAYASELQRVTTFGDEATLGVMAQMTAMGLSTAQTREAVVQAQNLATVMGTDLKSASRIMVDALEGNGNQLKRYLKGVDEAVLASGDMVAILREMEKAIGGQARAMAQTASGQITQFQNAVGDMKEEVGRAVVSAILPFVKAGESAILTFSALPAPIKDVIIQAGLLTLTLKALTATGMMPATAGLGSMLLMLRKMPLAFSLAGGGAAGFGAALTLAGRAVQGFLASLGPIGWAVITVGALALAFSRLKSETDILAHVQARQAAALEESRARYAALTGDVSGLTEAQRRYRQELIDTELAEARLRLQQQARATADARRRLQGMEAGQPLDPAYQIDTSGLRRDLAEQQALLEGADADVRALLEARAGLMQDAARAIVTPVDTQGLLALQKQLAEQQMRLAGESERAILGARLEGFSAQIAALRGFTEQELRLQIERATTLLELQRLDAREAEEAERDRSRVLLRLQEATQEGRITLLEEQYARERALLSGNQEALLQLEAEYQARLKALQTASESPSNSFESDLVKRSEAVREAANLALLDSSRLADALRTLEAHLYDLQTAGMDDTWVRELIRQLKLAMSELDMMGKLTDAVSQGLQNAFEAASVYVGEALAGMSENAESFGSVMLRVLASVARQMAAILTAQAAAMAIAGQYARAARLTAAAGALFVASGVATGVANRTQNSTQSTPTALPRPMPPPAPQPLPAYGMGSMATSSPVQRIVVQVQGQLVGDGRTLKSVIDREVSIQTASRP